MAEEHPPPRPIDEVLAVTCTGRDVFTTRLDGHQGRSFGGQTLGCATLAAARTCEGRALHSLHACFLRPIPADTPIGLHVERLKDGRRLAQRRVQIRSDERLLCELMVSFAAPGEGADRQEANVDPATPPPDELPSEEEVVRAEGWADWGPGPLEWRWVGTPWRRDSPDESSRFQTWVRPRFPLPDDRGVQAAALAFLGDFHSHWAIARKLGTSFEPDGYVSLDQVLWLHRNVAWSDWRLLTTENDVAHAGRALTRRSLHERDGSLIATMAQEMLIPAPPGGSC